MKGNGNKLTVLSLSLGQGAKELQFGPKATPGRAFREEWLRHLERSGEGSAVGKKHPVPEILARATLPDSQGDQAARGYRQGGGGEEGPLTWIRSLRQAAGAGPVIREEGKSPNRCESPAAGAILATTAFGNPAVLRNGPSLGAPELSAGPRASESAGRTVPAGGTQTGSGVWVTSGAHRLLSEEGPCCLGRAEYPPLPEGTASSDPAAAPVTRGPEAVPAGPAEPAAFPAEERPDAHQGQEQTRSFLPGMIRVGRSGKASGEDETAAVNVPDRDPGTPEDGARSGAGSVDGCPAGLAGNENGLVPGVAGEKTTRLGEGKEAGPETGPGGDRDPRLMGVGDTAGPAPGAAAGAMLPWRLEQGRLGAAPKEVGAKNQEAGRKVPQAEGNSQEVGAPGYVPDLRASRAWAAPADGAMAGGGALICKDGAIGEIYLGQKVVSDELRGAKGERGSAVDPKKAGLKETLTAGKQEVRAVATGAGLQEAPATASRDQAAPETVTVGGRLAGTQAGPSPAGDGVALATPGPGRESTHPHEGKGQGPLSSTAEAEKGRKPRWEMGGRPPYFEARLEKEDPPGKTRGTEAAWFPERAILGTEGNKAKAPGFGAEEGVVRSSPGAEQMVASFSGGSGSPEIGRRPDGDRAGSSGAPDGLAQRETLFSRPMAEKAPEIKLVLEPDHLGKLSVRVALTGEEVTARLQVVSVPAKEALEGGLHHLRETLQQQGIRLGEFSVALGQNGFRGDDTAAWPGQKTYRLLETPGEGVGSGEAGPAPSTRRHHEGLLDYLV